jgi:hypothetical protein
MRGAAVVVVQVVASLVIMGALMPGLMATVPAMRGARVGIVALGAGAVGVFVLLRLVWPRSKGK